MKRYLGNRLRYVLLFGCALAASAGAEIYRWVDANGVTHYSEDKPGTKGKPTTSATEVEEVSEKISRAGNFAAFTDVGPIEFYQPTRKKGPAKVDIRIETFAHELSKAERKRIDSQVRGLYQAYVRWFDWSIEPTHPITIKIFGKYELFEQYQIDTRGEFWTSRSHYSPYHREILMLGSSFAESTLQLLLHESSHAVMDMQVRSTSKWFNEGLASLFEGLVWERGNFFVRTQGSWSEKMNLKLREGSLAHLTDYLNIPNAKWGKESARVESSYYMIGWSIMRYLITTREGMRALAVALQSQRFYTGEPDQLANALGGAYPGGINKLDKDWRRWIASLNQA